MAVRIKEHLLDLFSASLHNFVDTVLDDDGSGGMPDPVPSGGMSGPVPYERFFTKPIGEVAGPLNSSTNQLAWESAVNSGEDLFFPDGAFYFEETIRPVASIYARGKDLTSLNAQSGFIDPILLDTKDLPVANVHFEGFDLHGQFLVDYAYGMVTPTRPNKGHHQLRNLLIRGGKKYQYHYPTDLSVSSSDGVGNRLVGVNLDSHNGAGLLKVGISTDDTAWESSRFRIFNSMDLIPIDISDTVLNFSMQNFFLWVGADFVSSSFNDQLIRIMSAAAPITFSNGFIEPAHITFKRFKYIFSLQSQTVSISDMILESGPVMPSGSAFAEILCAANGSRVSIESVVGNLMNMDTLLSLRTGDRGGSSFAKINVSNNSFANLAQINASAESTNNKEVAVITGSHIGESLHFGVQSTKTDLFLYRKPRANSINTQTSAFTVGLTDAFGIVRMNNAVSANCKFPASATTSIPVGTNIEIQRVGTGPLTVNASAGVDIVGDDFSATGASARYAALNDSKIFTKVSADEWLVRN